jgi:catechol 2,3-dioxygenase-like lactoylglutathione lyase family enzyme
MTDDQSTTNDEVPVTAERPDSATQLAGVDHITLIGSNIEDTVGFYRDVLGMPLVLRQPNLDQPEVTHLFFDTGDGRMLSFFVEEGRQS